MTDANTKPRQPKKSNDATASKKPRDASAPKKPRRPATERVKNRDTTAMDALVSWLNALNIEDQPTPSVHVNGHQFTLTSIITVDFGQPLKPVRIGAEHYHTLGEYLRAATKELLGRDLQIRVHNDASRGIIWSSLA